MIAIDHQTFGIVFALLLAVAALMIWRSLKAFNDANNEYNWHDLLMENGKASKAAHVMLGAFVATTWAFIYMTLTGKMDAVLFGVYSAAWIAPVVTRLVTNAPQAAAPSAPAVTTTTTTETATTTTPEKKRKK